MEPDPRKKWFVHSPGLPSLSAGWNPLYVQKKRNELFRFVFALKDSCKSFIKLEIGLLASIQARQRKG